ncbi:uncharacterized protein A1O5_10308 [Cladophialophora psammophila CBS 110553]|uniref:Thioesterase domain-containing protein n=1 Tax=Cladophialophora psammophila CBS 110553 TaxID=1182543 RepID=W9WEU0_9EURO|nr:uncharacterized protein A1O5_10308 [Cladophialophora psammophila CBS 110553]EXJ66637.1 hypothetical protein A1O5_10308 [Cladophialophora psammophila CBS 110553]
MSETNRINPHRKVFQIQNFLSLPLRERVLGLEKEILNDPNYFGFDTHSLQHANLELLDAQPNTVKWSLEIGPELCNKSGNLHGGAAATLLDNLTSTALLTIARDGFLDGGHVSRTITMSYLRPVPMGSKAIVDCEVQAAGRNTANIMGKIYVNGKLCVTCVHDKAVFSNQKQAKL